ncbi:MAG: hypothetical protein FJW56_06355 [Actinobacteria bacterium]|nr:hypothetical protein [Actinomycetota bacterium]
MVGKMIKVLLFKIILPRILKNVAPTGSIPRSGEEGEKVNCFFITFDNDKSPFFATTKYSNGTISGLRWDGNKYALEHSLNLKEIENYKFRVVHHYGLIDIYYKSIYDLAWDYFTRWVFIKIYIINKISSINQYFFNKKRLITKNRMQLLHFLLGDQIDGHNNGFDIHDLMTKLYSIRWVFHPYAESQQNKLELYLGSLVNSGELQKTNENYVVTGKALTTLENFELEEQRHVEAIKLQRKLFWLTLILVIIGLIQSGLIKLPTLLNIGGK